MIIANEEAMLAFGMSFGSKLAAGDWVAIDGPLGAGKTVLCKGILRGLGYGGEVASPSYALVHHYDTPDVAIAIAHADLYRIEDDDEFDELGLAEEQGERITLVEWAERARTRYGHPTYRILITPQSDGSRLLHMERTE